MIHHGLKPIQKDKRDYSFTRTFGATTNFPTEFNTDARLTMPNQDEVNAQYDPPIAPMPYGCTNYSQNELCIDEDDVLYRPDFTESKVHANESGGADIRTSLGSICQDGVQKQGEDASLAGIHKRTAYFNVEKSGDYFDSIRSAIYLNNRSVSIGTPWFREWATPQEGVITDVFIYSGNPSDYPWHNWKICGWKTIGGEPYLIGKTWQGPNYGDAGLAYFSRATINNVMAIPGTAAFTVAHADDADIQTVRIGLWQRLVYVLQELVTMLLHG